MGGSGRGVFVLERPRKNALFLLSQPVLEMTLAPWSASGSPVRGALPVTPVSPSYPLASCTPVHNIRYDINWFDTHDMGDYWNELENVNAKIELSKPKEETLVLRLNKGIKEQLAKIAKTKGLNISSLARMWLMEKLRTAH